jgi:transposase
VQRLNGREEFHFICLLLRRSRMLFVYHKFNAGETCSALYAFFILLGGRPELLVIDQDACLVSEEKYGEITNTRVFADFLREHQLSRSD